MRQLLLRAALVLCLPLTAGAPAYAAPDTKEFVQKVAISDMFEVEAGKLAADKAEHAEVKSFGDKMVADHTKTSEELKSIIAENKIDAEIPAELDAEHKEKLDALNKASDKEFDRTYVKQQVKAHKTAVQLFEDYASGGDNEQLKEWAKNTVPALKGHLEMAQSLQDEVEKAPAVAGADTKEGHDHQAMKDDAKSEKDAKSEADAGSINYVVKQQPTDWTTADLVGKTVVNPKNETLGEINNIILNERGDVVAVTIGVGGFLGIGEKDVGVPFNALEFKAASEVDAAEAEAEAKKADDQEERADKAEDAREERAEAAEEKAEARTDSEHDDLTIVLEATREQLEKAPAFVWLEERNAAGAMGERVVR